MAPLRRYLRITKHSVLEVRIYLERPSDAETWLIRRDNPALPRVIKAIRPFVLPKLREENERAQGRGGSKGKKKGVKDVVVEDDFEVSIFLTDLSARHSVMTKNKVAKDKPRIQSNSGKLTGWLTTNSHEDSMNVSGAEDQPVVLREESEDEVALQDIPEVSAEQGRGKRRRTTSAVEVISSESDSDTSFQPEAPPPSKRARRTRWRLDDTAAEELDADAQEDKKKLMLNTSYDGFTIYGRILCLIVKRKGPRAHPPGGKGATSSQQMLENWVSTQAAAEQVDNDDENG
ncbi:hypothetical protein M011DRAFT_497837 [Sporormia fimetaria CBS 119925]|uniref:Uncharacterized protein n=1 Tax=Sporormia fimetaria CBS 119925 TaxID=1340428 RepID=A0A6A6UUD2_9PLEO|nr:hypothetical protein M011DRAFT_497837 [Sporormia fimetaria CBS 119925]